MLADSVTDNDSNIMEQFKQIIDGQPLERKQMAVNVLRTIFSYFDKNDWLQVIRFQFCLPAGSSRNLHHPAAAW